MWILHLFPDTLILWICNLLLAAGIALTVAAFFINRIPIINQYRLPAQVLGIALLVLGVYFRGGYAVEAEWRERVAEVEARLAQAEQQSQQANVVLEKKGKDRILVIKEKGEVIKQYIDREITKYDNTCVIPDEVVKAHNAAARNEAIK
jgi:hypothetical protein